MFYGPASTSLLIQCTCVHLTFLFFPSPGASRGEIVIVAEEVQDSKYTIAMQLSASHLDKKDFFGKVDSIVSLGTDAWYAVLHTDS